jgi:hypothetical protein
MVPGMKGSKQFGIGRWSVGGASPRGSKPVCGVCDPTGGGSEGTLRGLGKTGFKSVSSSFHHPVRLPQIRRNDLPGLIHPLQFNKGDRPFVLIVSRVGAGLSEFLLTFVGGGKFGQGPCTTKIAMPPMKMI